MAAITAAYSKTCRRRKADMIVDIKLLPHAIIELKKLDIAPLNADFSNTWLFIMEL
jgi:hypothetical protein